MRMPRLVQKHAFGHSQLPGNWHGLRQRYVQAHFSAAAGSRTTRLVHDIMDQLSAAILVTTVSDPIVLCVVTKRLLPQLTRTSGAVNCSSRFIDWIRQFAAAYAA